MRALEDVSGRASGASSSSGSTSRVTRSSRWTSRWDKGVLTVSVKQTQATTDGVPNAFEVPLDLDGSPQGRREQGTSNVASSS
jgi:hypothetical protein